MGLFSETIAAQLAGARVQCAPLVEFDFTSGPMRLWRGAGLLPTNDGREWQALGQLGGIDGLAQAMGGTAPEATFTLSGVDAEIVHLARDEFEAEVRGRMVRVLIQFFGQDDAGDPDNQRCLDNPYPVWAGRCLKPRFELDASGQRRSIVVTAESLFATRNRPNSGMYTDRDQQARFPGDKGFEFAATLLTKVLTWPDF